MIISDFHTHSSNSGDSDEKMQVLVEEAIKNGNTIPKRTIDTDDPQGML